MTHHFNREEILNRLHDKISKKSPVIAAAAGIGLVAKIANTSNVDMIITTSSDYYRMDGHPSAMGYFAYNNANTLILSNGKKILKFSKNVPVIAGLGTGDPYREVDELAEEYWNMGFSGYINSPAAGMYGPYMEHHLSKTVLGLNADAQFISDMRKKNRLTVAIAVTAHQAELFAKAGADIIIAFAGYTVGGLKGAPSNMSRSLEETCDYVQKIYTVVKAVNSDAIILCQGASLNSPEAVQFCFDRTSAEGFYGASAFDRLPIENAVKKTVLSFKRLRLEHI